ncbi:DUF924-domain-containing protein [Xylariomycetidae sp. FL0641]|nr:DUF924-domain-containing protein [Xylariomycetidae sp. FL0641]
MEDNQPAQSSPLPDAADPANISRLLSFWFDHPDGLIKWFQPSPAVDAECQAWAPLVAAAGAGALDGWARTGGGPDGTLALLLLLDQLPRNVHRGTAAAFASDGAALRVALDAVARGDDRRVPLPRQMFFYLPLMHTEALLAQVGCLGLYQGMLARAEPGTPMHELLRGALAMAQVHVDIIRRFGRFPGRNQALGRQSTQEELAFLRDKGPRGF